MAFKFHFFKFLFFQSFVISLLISLMKAECNEDNVNISACDTSWNSDVLSKKEKDYCEKHLNITILEHFYSRNCTNKKCIAVSFEVFEGFEDCYSHYYVMLIRLKDCVALCHLVPTKNRAAAVDFLDLEVGQYKLLVEPKSSSHLRKQFFLRYLINVTNNIEDTAQSVFVKKLSFISTEIIVLSVVGILLFAAGIFIVHKRSGFIRRNNTVVPVLVEVDSLNCFTKAIKVYILHSHDDETTQKVKVLKDFLSLFFESILIEDELPKILVNRRQWLTDLLEYQRSDRKEEYTSNKRIVIVESRKVTKNRNSKVDEDIIEDSIFYDSIVSLDADRLRTLLDYHNIFVVRFDDLVPETSRLEHIVPGERYKIPEHVIDLCLNMSRCKNPKSQQLLRARFLAQFNNHKVKDLNSTIHTDVKV